MNLEKVGETLPSKNHPFIRDSSFWFSALGLVVITGLVYLPLLNNDFIISWDDDQLIMSNEYIRSLNWHSFHWMLTTDLAGYFVPLTWLSLALDYQINQLDPRVFHFTNLLFHIANTILVFGLCRKFLAIARPKQEVEKKDLHGQAAFLTALLFAIHPIHVESVAWATERKDVLSAFFFLSSLWLYLSYAGSTLKPKARLAACWILFIFSLMSKPTAVILPIIFLIFDFWPLCRFSLDFKKLFFEKTPFFLTSLLFSITTIFLSSKLDAIAPISHLSIHFRVINAFRSLVFYIWKMVLPYHLAPLYLVPTYSDTLYNAENYSAIVLVFVFSVIVFIYREKKPYLATAWLFYGVMLLPVIGLLQVGDQAAADRYTYLPSLAFFLPLSVGFVHLVGNRKWTYGILITVVTLGFGWMTFNQQAVWKNSVSLWEREVAAYPDSRHLNIVFSIMKTERRDDALRECDQAISISPSQIFPYLAKGEILLKKGLIDEAIPEFKTASGLNSNLATPHDCLWAAYQQKNMNEEAISEIQKAIELDPNSSQYYCNLAFSLRDLKRFNESEDAFKKALSFHPNNFNYVVNLALTYQISGHLTEALDWFEKGIAIDPNDARCWFELGHTYLLMEKYTDAINALQKAQSLDPQQKAIQDKLTEAYVKIAHISSISPSSIPEGLPSKTY